MAVAKRGTEQRRMRDIAASGKRTSYGEGETMNRLIAAATTTALIGGCSVLFMERLPKGYTPSKGEPRCTTSSGWPLWDSLIVVSAGVGAALMFKAADTARSTNQDAGPAVPVGILLVVDGLLHLLSARDGFIAADACASARKDRDAFLVRPTAHQAPRVMADAGVDAETIDAPIDAAPFVVDPEEPPAKGRN
jgi:hypothetical protein